jgi:hypothetical protein
MPDFGDIGRFAAAFLVPALFLLIVLYIWLTTRTERGKKDDNRDEKRAGESSRSKSGRDVH